MTCRIAMAPWERGVAEMQEKMRSMMWHGSAAIGTDASDVDGVFVRGVRALGGVFSGFNPSLRSRARHDAILAAR